MSYWIWVPLVVLEYALVAYATYRTNVSGGAWFYLMWAAGALPVWAFIAKHSKNVVFDGMLFDVLMTVTYTVAILAFTGSFSKLGPMQYAGLLAILLGLFLFKGG